ncbi:MAG: class II aldolase/adducin family protein [Rhodobacter sp.]|nr:class II aldolase/adducin family protein [Rhodobacter sp.]
MTEKPIPPADLTNLARYSARVGADPLLIQAAGGNTSVKDGDVMWIKASGTLLADALTREIFVPVDLPAMRVGFDDPSIDADQPAQFTLGGHTLRPSIETSLHAVFDRRVVIHVHCVMTLAHAVRADAEDLLTGKLGQFDWCLVPYDKPGANLAAAVRDRLKPETDVVVLRNHGLLVAADSIAGAEALLDRVVAALTLAPAADATPDIAALQALVRPGWIVPDVSSPLHQVALDPARLAQATGGSLYPDHVIFCGVGATALTGDTLPDPGDAPVFLLVPGKGAVVRADASAGALALMRCLGDVLLRVPGQARLTCLSPNQNAELLDWDAEKYRQTLDA